MSRCSRESDVLRAVRLGLVEDEMRTHAGECGECSDLLVLAGLLQEERRTAMTEASVPAAGALWFQMRLRAGRETRVRSARTLAAIQGASLLAALAIAIATFGVPSLPSLPSLSETRAAVQPLLTPWAIPLLSFAALFALFAPLAVWLAAGRSRS